MENQIQPNTQTPNAKNNKKNIALVGATVLLLIATGAGAFLLGRNSNNTDEEKKAATPTPTTLTQTSTLTKDMTGTATPTKTTTPSSVSMKTYTDQEEAMIQFEYPETFTVETEVEKYGSFEIYKTFKISKNQNEAMIIRFSSSAGMGCITDENKIHMVDALFKNKSTNENIARSRGNTEDGFGLPSYSTYSSETINKGSLLGCGLMTFTTKKYPQLNDDTGYLQISVELTNYNQDLSDFDKIVASIKRL